MATAWYLAGRSWFRIFDFFRHWYVSAFRVHFAHLVDRLEAFDRVIALRVTARFLFEPLYGDYSIIGYVFGFMFRLLRLAVGLAVYAAIITLYLALYLAWALVPPYLVFRTFTS